MFYFKGLRGKVKKLSKASLKGKMTVFAAVALSVVLIAVSVLAIYGVLPVAAPPTEIIVDNPAAQYVGAWPSSTAVAGYYGSNYQSHAAGSGANTATWSFAVPTAGSWEVYARWTNGTNRASNAPYTIHHAGGSTLVVRNQEVNGGSWQSLGTFSFNVAAYSVRLSNNANEYVIADAIRVTPVSVIEKGPLATKTGNVMRLYVGPYNWNATLIPTEGYRQITIFVRFTSGNLVPTYFETMPFLAGGVYGTANERINVMPDQFSRTYEVAGQYQAVSIGNSGVGYKYFNIYWYLTE